MSVPPPEVDRYISFPGQALAFKVGELKIKELRTDADPAVRPALLSAVDALRKSIDALETRLRVSPEMPIGSSRDGLVLEQVWAAVDSLQTSFDPPSLTQLTLLRIADESLTRYLADLDRFYANDVAAFRKRVAAAGLELIREVALPRV